MSDVFRGQRVLITGASRGIGLASTGVSVTVAYPGFVDTGIRERTAGHGLGRPRRTVGRVMSADRCAALILEAAARRRREVVMTVKGRVGRWLKLLVPRLVDRIAARSVGLPPTAWPPRGTPPRRT